jgi:hypothetical protein
MATKGKTQYQALVHFSVSRERGPADPITIDPGADLVEKGNDVWLDSDAPQTKQWLEQGAIRPWGKRNDPMPRVTARDLSGRRFPDQPKLAGTSADNTLRAQAQPISAANEGDAPEGSDPQPTDPDDKKSGKGSEDPYAK